MVDKKKRPTSPPWWVRAPLYAAVWPREDFDEYRINLQREYIRCRRCENKAKTLKFCLRRSMQWTFAAGQRFGYWFLFFVFRGT